MPRIYFNEEALTAKIQSDLKKATERVGRRLLRTLIEEYIDVYAYMGDDEWYEVTGEFRDSWRTDIRWLRGGWASTIRYDPTNVMGINKEKWQHYSNMRKMGGSSRHNLDKYLNTEGTVGVGWNFREGAYFDLFIKEVMDSGEAQEMLVEEMEKQRD